MLIPTKKRWFAVLFAFAILAIFLFSLPAPAPQPTEQSMSSTQQQARVTPASNDNDAIPMSEPIPTPPPKPASTLQSKPVVEYHIKVALDPEEKKLLGKQTLTWTHPGKQTVRELVLHLYPNAFRSNHTTFNTESGGKLRNDHMKTGTTGWMQLRSIKASNGEDLTHRLQFIQPDDGNEQDQTLAIVRLNEPVKAGQEVTLHLEFEVKLPEVYARMGYFDDFVMAGQWFPKVAAYEPDGRRGRKAEGWNMHQYHGNSEFYADFSIFNVQIQVPDDYTVAATGFPIQPATVRNKTKTYTYYAEDVHDFAWAASPQFIYFEEPFSTEHIPGVKLKLYLDPAHEALKHRYMYVIKKSLAAYAKWFGAYPYSTLSVVVPPAGANGAGGMEYPTLVTAWAADQDDPGLELERVIAHEIAHQYWYGMVANNEFQEAWLDEAFTSYAEDKLMQEEYGVASIRLLEASYITDPAPLKQNAWTYNSHNEYAENVYIRGKLVLMDIEQLIGESTMRKVLRTYFQRWKFKHPSTEDFQQVLEQTTKQSWKSYFDQFVYGDQMIDVAIEAAQSKPITHEGEPAYDNRVTIVSKDGEHGEIPIRFGFSDGQTTEQAWDGLNRRIDIRILSASPLEWVMIDPEYALVLENKRINNFYRLNINEQHKVRFNIGIAEVLEILLGWLTW